MAVLLTYDVASEHGKIKAQLMSPGYGYRVSIPGRALVDGLAVGKWQEAALPNTTLYHETKNPQQVADDITSTCRTFNAKLEKYIAFEVTNYWRGIQGE